MLVEKEIVEKKRILGRKNRPKNSYNIFWGSTKLWSKNFKNGPKIMTRGFGPNYLSDFYG